MSLRQSLAEFRLDPKSGAGIAVVVACACVMFYRIGRSFELESESPGETSRRRTVMDAQSGELLVSFRVPDGTHMPWTNPRTRAPTLYPTEMCYWARDGKAKMKPTYVILNETLGKPGFTICPDCGRVVVGHNPMPPADLILQAANAGE